MNLIFITLDGARIDRILKSPVIEELRKKGTAFTNMSTYAPYTIAAMHAIFSGEYGFRNGVNSYWSTFKFKKQKYKTLAQYLHDNGFQTFGDAINELTIPPQGFDELKYHDEDKDDLTKRHNTILKQMKELTDKGQKFFLYLHYSNIHTNIKNNVLTKYNNYSKEYFDQKPQNEKCYDEYFREAEIYIKNITEACKNIGLMQDTVIVIISDHGISVGDKFGERAYGVFCYDYTVKTFTLFIKEGLFPQKIIDQQVRSVDILPTILEIFNIKPDSSNDIISGKSLMPLVKGKIEERPAVIESGNPLKHEEPPKEHNIVAIRKNNWKLILNLYNDTRELYDLSNDPNEEKNLYGSNPELEKNLFKDLAELHPGLE